jgi:hypothetical protein
LQTKRICNFCGKEMDMWDAQQRFTICGRIGYGSIHDGDFVCLHLCCNCFDVLVSNCEISPIREETDA